jgi:molybdenum-dependent DNA-binding transcriptional regulator ModE
MTDKEPYILLKWGGLKGWGNLTDEQANALQKYADLGMSVSAIAQKNTDEHKQALCDALELFEDYQITNDWDGKNYTVEQAKKYVMEYGNG